MPRKGPAPKRPLVIDPVYGSPLVTQLVNKILLDGKKSIAETIVYGALEGARQKTGTDPVVTLKRALDNIKPSIEVKSRRVGGATYQVPIEVKPGRSTTLALRWMVGYSRQRREKTMTERLMNEILDASNGLGAAVKRREDTHKMAESNKAFAHYRWLGATGPGPHASGGGPGPHPRTDVARQIPFPARTTAAHPSRRDEKNHRGTRRPYGPDQGPQHRHHGPHRCRQDDDDRADPVLHRHHVQDR